MTFASLKQRLAYETKYLYLDIFCITGCMCHGGLARSMKISIKAFESHRTATLQSCSFSQSERPTSSDKVSAHMLDLWPKKEEKAKISYPVGSLKIPPPEAALQLGIELPSVLRVSPSEALIQGTCNAEIFHLTLEIESKNKNQEILMGNLSGNWRWTQEINNLTMSEIIEKEEG